MPSVARNNIRTSLPHYRVVDGRLAGNFDLQLLGLDGIFQRITMAPEIWSRELSKELELLKEPVEQYYKDAAPFKQGPWEDRFYTTPDAAKGQHLRDSITARRALKGTTLELRMAWWGWMTINGRAAQGPRSTVYRIELPGGEVIYRHRTAAVGEGEYGGGPEAMKWAENAYRALKANDVFKSGLENIIQRYTYSIFNDNSLGSTGKWVQAAYKASGTSPPHRASHSYAEQLRTSRFKRQHYTAKDAYLAQQGRARGRPSVNPSSEVALARYQTRRQALLQEFRKYSERAARKKDTNLHGVPESLQKLRKYEYRHSQTLVAHYRAQGKHESADAIMEKYAHHSREYGNIVSGLRGRIFDFHNPGVREKRAEAAHVRELAKLERMRVEKEDARAAREVSRHMRVLRARNPRAEQEAMDARMKQSLDRYERRQGKILADRLRAEYELKKKMKKHGFK